MWRLDSAGRGTKTATYGTLACLVFGVCGWLMVNAVRVNDHWVGGGLLVLCLAAWLPIGRAMLRRPDRTPKVFSAVWWGLALINLTVVNLRWDAWFGGAPLHQFPTRLAPWAVNYWIVLLFATVRISWWLRRYFLALPDARQAAKMVIGVYLAVMLSGAVLLAVMK